MCEKFDTDVLEALFNSVQFPAMRQLSYQFTYAGRQVSVSPV